MNQSPFGGIVGLKIRFGGLLLFSLLFLIFLFKHNRGYEIYTGAYLLLGAFDTRRYYRHLKQTQLRDNSTSR